MIKSLIVSLVATGVQVATPDMTLEGVTFANAKGKLYLPLREGAQAIGAYVHWEPNKPLTINDVPLDDSEVRRLFDGTKLVPLRVFESTGAKIEYDYEKGSALIAASNKTVLVVTPPKTVQVSLDEQELRAWQGDRLVMVTNISSGRSGHRTPTGKFKAGPQKSRMHYSSLYNNAPMPYAVQINGDIFIHGYKSVPSYAASHGCVRMPLHGMNAAKWFFEWVDVGTPVTVARAFMPQGASEAQS